MNLPNKLSVIRVALILPMILLLLPDNSLCSIIAAAVFGLAALTDFLDGHIARSRHLVTDFGKFIDPVADKLLVLSALTMLVQRGLVPAWLVVVLLARELSVDGLRMVAVTKGQVIAAGKLGKIKTASQMFTILWLMLIGAPVWSAASFAAFTPLTIISTLGALWVAVIAVWSGIDYFVKNASCIMDR